MARQRLSSAPFFASPRNPRSRIVKSLVSLKSLVPKSPRFGRENFVTRAWSPGLGASFHANAANPGQLPLDTSFAHCRFPYSPVDCRAWLRHPVRVAVCLGAIAACHRRWIHLGRRRYVKRSRRRGRRNMADIGELPAPVFCQGAAAIEGQAQRLLSARA